MAESFFLSFKLLQYYILSVSLLSLLRQFLQFYRCVTLSNITSKKPNAEADHLRT